jgi:hypothetical protein
LILVAPIQYFSAFESHYLTKVQGMKLSVFEILKINLATNFYSFFLPGTISGGAVKWYKFSKHTDKSAAAAVIVFNRILEILITIFLAILFSLPLLYLEGYQMLFFVLLFVFLFLVAVYFLLFSKKGLFIIEKSISDLSLPVFFSGLVMKFIVALRQFQNLKLKDHIEIIALLFLYHGIGVVSFYCLALSLGIDLSFWVISWVGAITSVATMIPISFAGLGIREGTLVFLFSQFNIMPGVSLALSFLLFSRSILVTFSGGLFELQENFISKKSKERNSITTIGQG